LIAQSARRKIDELARLHGVQCRFETVKGAIREAIASVSEATDILVVAEPHNPVERVIAPFAQLLRAAFSSSATVLFVPRRIVRSRGPVVAIALTPDDASIGTAEAFARAMRENLIVIEAFDSEHKKSDEVTGPPVTIAGTVYGRLTVARRALADVRALAVALDGLGERMIVVARGAFGGTDGEQPAGLAALCGVPVLLVEPAGVPTGPNPDSNTA
jgi:hypothetical protein